MRVDRHKSSFSPNQLFGAEIESYAADQIRNRGLTPKFTENWIDRYDMLVSDSKSATVIVEVKGANPKHQKSGKYYRTRWQWDNSRGTSEQDIVLLVAVTDNQFYVYIVPKKKLMDKPGNVSITSHPEKYTGWLAEYRDAWYILDQALA